MPSRVQLGYRVRVSDSETHTTFETVIQRDFDLADDLAQARDQRLGQYVRQLWRRDTGYHLGSHIYIGPCEQFSIQDYDDDGRLLIEHLCYLRSNPRRHKTDWTLVWHDSLHQQQHTTWTEPNEPNV